MNHIFSEIEVAPGRWQSTDFLSSGRLPVLKERIWEV